MPRQSRTAAFNRSGKKPRKIPGDRTACCPSEERLRRPRPPKLEERRRKQFMAFSLPLIASQELAMTLRGPARQSRAMATRPLHVIARNSCDDAIQFLSVALDCFARARNDVEGSARQSRAMATRPLHVIARSSCDDAIQACLRYRIASPNLSSGAHSGEPEALFFEKRSQLDHAWLAIALPSAACAAASRAIGTR
jgi:hypothetical protein